MRARTVAMVGGLALAGIALAMLAIPGARDIGIGSVRELLGQTDGAQEPIDEGGGLPYDGPPPLTEDERAGLAEEARTLITGDEGAVRVALDALARALEQGEVIVDGVPLRPFGEGVDIVSLEPMTSSMQVYVTPGGELVYLFYASARYVFAGDEIAQTTRLPLRRTDAGWEPSPYLPDDADLRFVEEIALD